MTSSLLDYPSFVDLRAFAAAAVVPTDGHGDPFLERRQSLGLPADAPVVIEVVRPGAGQGHVDRSAGDEFLVVSEGAVTIAGKRYVEGESLVIPRGAAFDWAIEDAATLIAMRYVRGDAEADAVVPIDNEATLVPSGAPLAELLLTPTPQCRNYTDFRSADGEFVCGTWDSTPYHRSTMRYVHYELMYLLDGAVTFVDEAGRSGTFSKDDIFLVQQGASCSWNSQVHVKKIYAIYRPVA